MRKQIAVGWAAASIAVASPALAEDAADIRAAEARFTEATRSKDAAALDAILAPEFELVGGEAEAGSGVPRAAWLANLGRMTLTEYQTDVTDVRVNGGIAVATVRGNWTVRIGERGGREAFLLRDVWVRRGPGWQLVRRYRVGEGGRPNRQGARRP
jgi:ketosteroid isomerase-like protein